MPLTSSNKRWIAAVGAMIAVGGLAIAATNGAGFRIVEDTGAGLGGGSSPSGFTDQSSAPALAGSGSSPSGFSSVSGSHSPPSTPTSVHDWQQLND